MAFFTEQLVMGEYQRALSAAIKKKTPCALHALQPMQKVQIGGALGEKLCKQVLFIAPNEQQAERILEDLLFFAGTEKIAYFPPKDISFSDVDVKSLQWENKRVAALMKISSGEADYILTTIDALMQPCPSPLNLKNNSRKIKETDGVDPSELSLFLSEAGYTLSEKTEGPGQYSRRGGIIDIFSPNYEKPVRIDLFGDEIDSLSFFDVLSQRREDEKLKEVFILPAKETIFTLEEKKFLLSRLKGAADQKVLNRDIERLKEGLPLPSAEKYSGFFSEKRDFLSQYFKEGLLIFTDYFMIKSAGEGYFEQITEDFLSAKENLLLPSDAENIISSFEDFLHKSLCYPMFLFDSLPRNYEDFRVKETLTAITKPTNAFQGSLELLASDCADYKKQGFSQIITCGSYERAKRISDFLERENLPSVIAQKRDKAITPGEILIYPFPLSTGGEYTKEKLIYYAEGELVYHRKRRTANKKDAGQKIKSYTDLKKGDYVVHINHGIGRFEGIHSLTVEGVTRDYLKIHYKGSDVLYVPCDQLEMISKYMGAEGGRVKISKLGGNEWAKTTEKVKAAVRDMAKELLLLYSKRAHEKGFEFSPDNDFQRDFESRFEYDETEDQLRCSAEIKSDMEKSLPMERLLCGDVGFGKTEVALRAVFKCINDSKQAAILVPTTVLAQQHYETMLRRFAGFPISVEVLSSMKTPLQHKDILKRLKNGSIDVIVGTHSLLQPKIEFKDLGLLVVDEEQRFGVKQKERIKEMAVGVDILTLSATPIPRTLNMALGGIRDMSVIEEAPKDRLPVQTYVLEYNRVVVLDAIRKEIRRGGQVYYLHNRIEDIDTCVQKLRKDVPEARIVCAHGKMSEVELFAAVTALIKEEADVLVCTTIIESGIDIPNVNTIIVEDADNLGLAQLHQIRGRVGRSTRRAYAYFTYRRGKLLSEEAAKRLNAIREFAEFGAGFKIALRDLEIRGAGNLLGREQHGHLESVGYDLYQKLLADAVQMEKEGKQQSKREISCVLDLKVNAYIPSEYIQSYEERIDIYKKISEIEDERDEIAVKDELLDRYGDIPEVAISLIELSKIKNQAKKYLVTEISQKESLLFIYFEKEAAEVFVKALPEGKCDMKIDFSLRPCLKILIRKDQKTNEVLKNLLLRLQEAQKLI